MTNEDLIFQKIAEALLVDYSSVYYVNAVTNEYQWYSSDPEYHSLQLAQNGRDFFTDLVRDAKQLIYPDDIHIFTEEMTKEKLMAQMKKGAMLSFEYRLMIDGRPVYHTLRLIRGLSGDDDYFIFGVLNVDEEVRKRQEAERAERERTIYNQIAGSLAARYDTLYYIDMKTDHFFEFSSTETYKSLEIPTIGDDFFSESRKNIPKYAHPDDIARVLRVVDKENMLKTLSEKSSFSITYRLQVLGEYIYCRLSGIWARDHQHVILGVQNVNDEITRAQELKESRQKSMTYGSIVESLASRYDVIYYVDAAVGSYTGYTANSIYGNLEVQEQGEHFFEDCIRNSEALLYPEDKERIQNILNLDYLISTLESHRQFSADYRMVVDGQVKYTRLTVFWASDRNHFIIGVENIDDEVKKEKAHMQALHQANEMARRDELTGIKNKTAYHELEEAVQKCLESPEDYFPFGIAVCDINNLKLINDTLGHKAGDEHIRTACKMICHVFSHSPVFRIGGDEFVVFLSDTDYVNRFSLMKTLQEMVLKNLHTADQPVIAVGMSECIRESDRSLSTVFERADSRMYEDKIRLKEYAKLENDPALQSITCRIPDDAKMRLDSLFEALSVVAEGAYVYLCNMQYDYSRWSKTAVDTFGLPSEYMYGAGDIWEKHIHPEDRETYHNGIQDVFAGNSAGHDMQYRACKPDGEYDICTCRGIVLRDENGQPAYFGGAIRNHGIQGHIDMLTGLRNQYGFFEDLQAGLIRRKIMRIALIGISKFSEINEIYGYHFGNRILQAFGRYLFTHIGNTGNVYRLDGTKFAVLTNTYSVAEMTGQYNDLRSYFREHFSIGDRRILLDLNAGLLTVDNFDVDYQTVYACLNFAYNMSKVRMQGELVEFYNDLNDENKHRIEKLHAIRASITEHFKGFYLLYQPVVDAHTEELIGAEALLRWRSEEYGMVPPDHFIPILEKDPFFCDLGKWILEQSITAAEQILSNNPNFVMNVNIAYTQLERPDFVDMVLGILDQTGFPPQHLCLEITERCRLLDMDLLKNALVNLRGRGVLIALDDFGTGFSSIGVVKMLPFDIIKIDRCFVMRIEEDEKDRELIRSFAGVASTFGAKVCVEGIETEGMRDILQQFSVRSFQGYYYSKPLTLEDFLAWNQRKPSMLPHKKNPLKRPNA